LTDSLHAFKTLVSFRSSKLLKKIYYLKFMPSPQLFDLIQLILDLTRDSEGQKKTHQLF